VNVPAAGNVRLNFAPAASEPEFHDPSSPVVVCAVTSLLVHVTVPPTEIETGFGEYAVVVRFDEPFTMETDVPVLVDGDVEDPQPTVKLINAASTLNRSVMSLSIPGMGTTNR